MSWAFNNLAWLCVVWLLGGVIAIMAWGKLPRPIVKPAETDDRDRADFYRKNNMRLIGRVLALSWRVAELEEKNRLLLEALGVAWSKGSYEPGDRRSFDVARGAAEGMGV